MQITQQHRQQFTVWFLVIFYLLAAYKWYNGLWLFQVKPFFFVNTFDGISWLLQLTGMHEWLINNKAGCILFDSLFYGFPLVYYFAYRYNENAGRIIAFLWLLFNWIYVLCYTLYPTNSIEGHIPWLLMPLLFSTKRLAGFYYVMHGFRYFLLFFFVSAAIWKFRQGGLFYSHEMSGILLLQHGTYLVSSPDDWYTRLIYFIIRRPALGQALYVAATVLEITFIIGFFTRKYDKMLIAAFVLFLLVDHLIMRIPYYEILPLALLLLFSKYDEPVIKKDYLK